MELIAIISESFLEGLQRRILQLGISSVVNNCMSNYVLSKVVSLVGPQNNSMLCISYQQILN